MSGASHGVSSHCSMMAEMLSIPSASRGGLHRRRDSMPWTGGLLSRRAPCTINSKYYLLMVQARCSSAERMRRVSRTRASWQNCMPGCRHRKPDDVRRPAAAFAADGGCARAARRAGCRPRSAGRSAGAQFRGGGVPASRLPASRRGIRAPELAAQRGGAARARAAGRARVADRRRRIRAGGGTAARSRARCAGAQTGPRRQPGMAAGALCRRRHRTGAGRAISNW